MVVLMRPTFERREIIANSLPKRGDSRILSLDALEHLGEWMRAFTYRSRKVTLVPAGSPRMVVDGSGKTACLSLKMASSRSYWRSTRVRGSPSWRLTARFFLWDWELEEGERVHGWGQTEER